jgi:hypothetical protein
MTGFVSQMMPMQVDLGELVPVHPATRPGSRRFDPIGPSTFSRVETASEGVASSRMNSMLCEVRVGRVHRRRDAEHDGAIRGIVLSPEKTSGTTRSD